MSISVPWMRVPSPTWYVALVLLAAPVAGRAGPPVLPDWEVRRLRMDTGGRLYVTVANSGTAATPTPLLDVFVDHAQLGSISVPQLALGVEFEIDTGIHISGTDRRVLAVIDPVQSVAELNEYQNSHGWIVETTPSRTGFDLALAARAGGADELILDLTNLGDQSSPPGFAAVLTVYLDGSSSPAFTQNVAIPSLSPQGLTTYPTTIILPNESQPAVRLRAELVYTSLGGVDMDTTNNVVDTVMRSVSLADIDVIYGPLLNDADIQNALLWQPLCGPSDPYPPACPEPLLPYPQWPAPMQDMLREYLWTLELGEELPISGPPPIELAGGYYYLADSDAVSIFVGYTAQSLWFNVHGFELYGCTWSLSTMTVPELTGALPLRPTQTRKPSGAWGYNAGGNGNKLHVRWNPRVLYSLAANLGWIAPTQEQTIYRVLDWWRGHTQHGSGLGGPTGIERFFYGGYTTGGCGPTALLWTNVFDTLNIPKRARLVTYVGSAVCPCPVAVHSSFEFLSLGMRVGHNDEFLATGSSAPYGRSTLATGSMFYTLEEGDSLLDDPNLCDPGDHLLNPDGPESLYCSEPGVCHWCPQQVTYNDHRFQRILQRNSPDAPTGFWPDLFCRSGSTAVVQLLRAPDMGNGTDEFLLPLLDESERGEFLAAVQVELNNLGNGDPSAGCDWISARRIRFTSNICPTLVQQNCAVLLLPSGANQLPVPSVQAYPLNAAPGSYPAFGKRSTIPLLGKGSDADSGPQSVTYLWSAYPATNPGVLNSATSAEATFSLPNTIQGGEGQYTFRLTVFDGADMAHADFTVNTSLGYGSPPVVVQEGSRYFGVTPVPRTFQNSPIAIRVTSSESDLSCLDAYVAQDGSVSSTPVYQTALTWGTVHVRGSASTPWVPGRVYNVSVVAQGAGGASGSTSVETWAWGDVNGDGLVTVVDQSAVSDVLAGAKVGALWNKAADLAGCMPNGAVDVLDLSAAVDAMLGHPFSSTCSTVPCP